MLTIQALVSVPSLLFVLLLLLYVVLALSLSPSRSRSLSLFVAVVVYYGPPVVATMTPWPIGRHSDPPIRNWVLMSLFLDGHEPPRVCATSVVAYI